jgi:hypothetical protein
MKASAQLHILTALPTGYNSKYLLVRRGVRFHILSECGGKKNPCPYWESNPTHPAHSSHVTDYSRMALTFILKSSARFLG